MDYSTGRPNHIEDYLVTVRTGQWFGWSDHTNKIYANLIVLDEPFVGLDIENQNILSNFLNKQLQKEIGIIFTSHINCNVDSKTIKID